MNLRQLLAGLKELVRWMENDLASLEAYHAFAQRNRASPGCNVYDFVLQVAESRQPDEVFRREIMLTVAHECAAFAAAEQHEAKCMANQYLGKRQEWMAHERWAAREHTAWMIADSIRKRFGLPQVPHEDIQVEVKDK